MKTKCKYFCLHCPFISNETMGVMVPMAPTAPIVKKVTDDSSIPPCDLSDEWDQLIGHLFVLLK